VNINRLPRLKTAGGSQNHELPTGEGTEANPFRVYSVAALKKVGTGTDGWGADKHYLQILDVRLTRQTVYQSNWTPISTFTGTYDGGGYTVSNLTIYGIASRQGMFGYIGEGGVVKNLGLVDVTINTGNYVGGVAGYNSGMIDNCYTTGGISYFEYNSKENPGGSNFGGIAGENSGTVQNCYTTVSVSGGRTNTGGVVGYNYKGTVQNCYATGSVSGGYGTGGVVGTNSGTARNCVALNSRVTSSDAESIGRVTGYYSTGMSNNYAKVDMSISRTVINEHTSADGANIDSRYFNDENWWKNTANWDFSNTWEMNNNNLPKLKNAGGVQDHFVPTTAGTEDDPYFVFDADSLKKVGSDTDSLKKHYKQVRDITLSGDWTAIGTSAAPFTGSFNGNGFTVSNLTINKTATHQGLFGHIGSGGVVKNIALVNVNISGGNNTGGIAGQNDGTIQNCYTTGSVNGGNNTGGIAGYNNNNNGTIQNCYSTSSVSGGNNVGGVAGQQNNGTVQNCYAIGRISGTSNIGGVVGSGGTVRNCVALNTGVITSGNISTLGRVAGGEHQSFQQLCA
jgi:hypothetical protein